MMNAHPRARARTPTRGICFSAAFLALLDMNLVFCYTIFATHFRLPFFLAQRAVIRVHSRSFAFMIPCQSPGR